MKLSATSLIGDDVRNASGEDLGKIEDLMIDVSDGSVEYAVLTFGGVLGMGNKLFAVPMKAMSLDINDKCFVLNVEQGRLENSPGFDKDNWPDMANAEWRQSIHSHYGI